MKVRAMIQYKAGIFAGNSILRIPQKSLLARHIVGVTMFVSEAKSVAKASLRIQLTGMKTGVQKQTHFLRN